MARSISAFQSWRQHTFAALENRHFRVLFIGTLFATFAYMMMMLVMSLVAYDLSGNNASVGLIAAGVGVAMLLAPFGGVIADRVDRKWLIVFGQGGGAAMLLLTGLLLVFDVMTLPLMFALMMVLGFTFVLMGPARNAFTADLVGPRLVGNAIVLSQLAHTWGQPLSPFVAAILVESVIGSGGTYIVMGTLVSIGVFTVAVMPNRKNSMPARSAAGADASPRGRTGAGATIAGVLRDIADGALYVMRRPQLRLMMLLFVSGVVLGSIFRILLPAFLDRQLGEDPNDIGLLMLVYGIGAALISLVVAGAATTRWAWPVIFVMTAVMGLAYLIMAGAPNMGVLLIAMALLGPGMQGPVMILQARIMMHTESAYYGRVMSFTMMSWGVQMLVGLPAGILADLLGEREVFAGIGLAGFLVTGLGVMGWLAIRKHDQRPALPPLPTPAAAAHPNGNGAAVPVLPPPLLRPVALMSGQKIDS